MRFHDFSKLDWEEIHGEVNERMIVENAMELPEFHYANDFLVPVSSTACSSSC